MALLLFDGDFIKLKCIKQEISLRTIRALFHKKTSALQPWSWTLIQETLSLSIGTDQVPTFNLSLLALYVHLIWLCPLQKGQMKRHLVRKHQWNTSKNAQRILWHYRGRCFLLSLADWQYDSCQTDKCFTLKHRLPKSFWLKAYCTPQDYREKILH